MRASSRRESAMSGFIGKRTQNIHGVHIVYGVGGTLRAVGFDLDRLEVTSDPIPVVDRVNMKRSGAAHFGVAQDGSLAYVRGGGVGTGESTLVWVERDGREEPCCSHNHCGDHRANIRRGACKR